MKKHSREINIAYKKGEYTDKHGVKWVLGMDGWFDHSNPGIIHLMRHTDMERLIDEEAGNTPPSDDE